MIAGVLNMGGILQKNLIQPAQDFLKDDFNKFLLVAILAVGALVLANPFAIGAYEQNQQASVNSSFIHFFYYSGCPHCHEQMDKLNPVLEEKYGVQIISHEITSPSGRELFKRICGERGLGENTPTTLVGNQTFVGYNEKIGAKIEAAVLECAESGCNDPITGEFSVCKQEEQDFTFDIPFMGKTDLRQMSLPALAVVLGLVDGFNPCAMWVLVYLIALVMELQDRRKIWLIVGSFVLSSGILYFLFMTAWLNAFLFLGYVRIVSVIIGMAALGGGILGLKEYWQTRGKPLECKVGDAGDKKKMMAHAREIVSKPLTWATFFAIVALAFVVNSVEFVCSSAIPAVFTQVLAISSLSTLEYYAYILLYDIFFMLDDLIIFGLAAFAVSSTDVGEKYAKYCKLIGGAILTILGFLLLFAPGMLR